MNSFDAALAGSTGGHDGFAALRDLLAIVADPTVAQARAEALQVQLAALAEGRSALAAEREAFATEKAQAEAKIAEERAAAGRMMAAAYDERRTVASLREQAEAFAERTGYRERASVVPVGNSGLTMTTFEDEPPRYANVEPSPSRVSDERFGQSSLTRHADAEFPERGFRGAKARR